MSIVVLGLALCIGVKPVARVGVLSYLPTSAICSEQKQASMKAYPLESHQMCKKALDTRYAFDGATASFIKNILEQTDFDGYGKLLYHLIGWALLKRRHTHTNMRFAEAKKKKKKLPLRFPLLLIVATTVVSEVIFPSSSIFACEKGGREGHSLTFFLMLKLTPYLGTY